MAGNSEEKRAQGMYCDEGVKLEPFFFQISSAGLRQNDRFARCLPARSKKVQIIIRRSDFGKPFAIHR